MKKVEIFCTLGPSSLNKKFLRMAEAKKVDLVRLNMSHLSIASLKKNLRLIKKYSKLKICIDTEGAQIRTKIDKVRNLKKGQKISIHKNKKFHLYPDYVYEKLKKTDKLEVGFDGLILKIIKKTKNSFLTKCIQSGSLEKNKGVHLSNRKIKLNYLTNKDLKAIEVGKKFKIKNYALSFTNSVSDVKQFSKLLPKKIKFTKSKLLKHLEILRHLKIFQIIF